MPEWLTNILPTVLTLLVTLSVTFLFNKLVGWPKELKKQREEARQKEEAQRQENIARDAKIAALEATVAALPSYRAQSIQIQTDLQRTDQEILAACADIKSSVVENQHVLNDRIDRLERREKNAIRAKLLDEHRLFTDEIKNPMLAWTEMEHHAFFKLVEDYEDLGGNDYVHSDVLPAMNRLDVIRMEDKQSLLKLMSSRKL